jgi:ABC-2 type transport system permease protein
MTATQRLVPALRRVRSVARKELRQLVRDRLTMGFVVGVPIAQLLLFGYAINQDVRGVKSAVVDHSSSSLSRRILGQLQATQTLSFVAWPASEEAARDDLEEGRVDVVVIIPHDFTASYYRGRGAELSILVNATDPVLARAVRASAAGLAERLNQRLQPFLIEGSPLALRSALDRQSFFAEPELVHRQHLHFAVLNYYNPELRTAMFVVPGLLGVILTTTMILMTAVALVRERERGTFEFLIATPVRRIELMVGKILPYVGIGLVQIALFLITGLWLFRVPVEGSLFDLGISSILFIGANLTLGLVISSVTSSQLQATQISFFVFLPSVLLSGFMFPFDTMPRPAQWLGEILPLTHYIRSVKGILLRGSGLTDQLVDLGAMLLFMMVGLVIATRSFRKQLD